MGLTLLAAGCGSDSGVRITIKDQSNQAVEGVEIRQSGTNNLLGTTDAQGVVTISPDRSQGEVTFRLKKEDTETARYLFENSSYTLRDEDYDVGSLFFRADRIDNESLQTASLEISSTPPGADIFVNGEKKGTTDTILEDLPLGEAEIVLSMSGMLPDSSRFFLEAGLQPYPHQVTLKSEAVQTAEVTVSSDPTGARIYLNGTRTNNVTPATLTELDPGSYRIKVTKGGFQSQERSMNLRRGAQAQLDFGQLAENTPPPQTQTSTTPPQTKTKTQTPTKTSTPREKFKKTYLISTKPAWAEVYLDGDPRARNTAGNFRTVLSEGVHTFRVVNSRIPVDRVIQYEVKPGDKNSKLVLNYKLGKVIASP
ncbi:MAG: PEGA domain-containing protein [Candidatus Eisenbacteria bacterium]|uniref:PEGA domain-containing protein n=1 Tax=Eiseniibacteriota bacterium TaxID=2212470 RepID=A0A7Y2H286_UNCEI|nr:PEGA domain-containing protein [Candidatus Eisenbacteria bacterium]